MPDITRFRLPSFEWEQIDDERWATRNTPESGGWSLEAAKHGRGYYVAVNGGFTEVSLAYEIRWSVFRDTLEGAKRAAEEYVESLCRACMVVDERAVGDAEDPARSALARLVAAIRHMPTIPPITAEEHAEVNALREKRDAALAEAERALEENR